MADVERMTRHTFTELTTTWLSDILPNLVVGTEKRMQLTANKVSNARMNAELTAVEHRTDRPLMQQILQASLLPPRTTRAIMTQILPDPATVRDIVKVILIVVEM